MTGEAASGTEEEQEVQGEEKEGEDSAAQVYHAQGKVGGVPQPDSPGAHAPAGRSQLPQAMEVH